MVLGKGEGFKIWYNQRRKHLDLVVEEITAKDSCISLKVVAGDLEERYRIDRGERIRLNLYPIFIWNNGVMDGRNERVVDLILEAPKDFQWKKTYR